MFQYVTNLENEVVELKAMNQELDRENKRLQMTIDCQAKEVSMYFEFMSTIGQPIWVGPNRWVVQILDPQP